MIDECYQPPPHSDLTRKEADELREYVRFLLSNGRHLEASRLRKHFFPLV